MHNRDSSKLIIDATTRDKNILRKFLKAGFMEKGEIHPTERGAAQGGSISPTLAVMALTGIEHKLRSANKTQQCKEKINVIVYADDFVVTAASETLLKEKVIPILKAALKEVGLALSEEKTKITQIENGFDFLGFNVRKYRNKKLIIKPSKASVTTFLREIKRTIKKCIALPTEILIRQLNQKLTGWVNYYRSVVSSRVFAKVDSEIFTTLKRWCYKRHHRKGKCWIIRNYFKSVGNDNWRFYCVIKDKEGKKKSIYLKKASNTLIRRHKKILGNANPFDPRYKEYFRKREEERKTRIRSTNHVNSAGLRIIQPYEGLSGVP